MPRFFFRVCDDHDCEDPEGIELPDLDAAYQEAIRGARSIMAEQVNKGRLLLTGRIEIKDQSGRIALFVSFREAVEVDS